jgi:hypothetical protein
VQFSTITLSVPEGGASRIDARLFGGRRLTVVAGVNEDLQTAYLGVGEQALEKLKSAIDASAVPDAEPPPAMFACLRLGPLISLAAEMQPSQHYLRHALPVLLTGGDRITFWAKHTDAGYHLRLFDIEEGGLRALAHVLTASGLSLSAGAPARKRPHAPARGPVARAPPPKADPETLAQNFLRMGNLLESRGRLEAAAERYRQAVSANPDGEAATKARKQLERIK